MSEIRRVASDGLELEVESFGEGSPLIFAHGLTGNRHLIRRQLEALSDQYRVIIFDQRGHCHSTPVTDAALYEAERMAGDMGAVMDALGVERAVVGGESMGAATALLFALRSPERVTKLLLTGPAFGDSLNPGREQIHLMGSAIREHGIDAFLSVSAERQSVEWGAPPEVIATISGMHRSHDPASLATACRTVIDWVILPDFSQLSQLDRPACVIAWENDPLHPVELAQRIVAALPDARLEMIPSLLDLFADPAIIGRIYERFLKGT